jgi:hypothetical protein
MISIREFTSQVMKHALDSEEVRPIDWNSVLEDQGYYSVKLRYRNQECYAWCDEQFGQEHFVWTGSNFFFETEQDAIMFTLRWA